MFLFFLRTRYARIAHILRTKSQPFYAQITHTKRSVICIIYFLKHQNGFSKLKSKNIQKNLVP
jgi:hypothetical protein